MGRLFRYLIVAIGLMLPLTVQAADHDWISHPAARATPTVVMRFRHDLTLAKAPGQLWLDVSADNRFVLYVNDVRVAAGPATSDLGHWRYARIDIAPYLKRGVNHVTADVWNFVDQGNSEDFTQTGPMAQQSALPAFYVKAEDAAFGGLDGHAGWQVAIDAGRWPEAGMKNVMPSNWKGYYVASAPEVIDANRALGAWVAAVPALSPGQAAPWRLSADPLPQMTYDRVDSGELVRGGPEGGDFPRHPLVIAAHSHVRLMIRRDVLGAAYPRLLVSQGKGARIKVTYAEALYDGDEMKGVRDEVGERHIKGLSDTFLADGQARVFAPLYWRAWRFVELDIETQAAPLRLEGFEAYETGYPFQQVAQFCSNDAELNDIWQIGWRTAKFDAHETYMDSAYWEQLQYIGDTRIQALISYAVSGDARLAVNAIDAFGWSNSHDGITESAYPSRGKNPIAPFSLLWIGMMHDYWMRQPDTAVVVRNLPRAREVLAWYRGYLRPDGLLSRNPTWNFVDWVGKEREDFPSFDAAGESCLTSLFYIGALQQAADLETAMGEAGRAADDLATAGAVTAAVRAKCWDEGRQMFADDPSKTLFSQHANILAVLYDVAGPNDQAALLRRITTGRGIEAAPGLIPVSYYFAWYLGQAYDHAGMADAYPGMLSTWRDMLKLHFTTWPEQGGDTRSDGHAWTAHPTADLLGMVAGVGPMAPGYGRVRIAPHLGELTQLHAVTQTPSGPVTTDYRVTDGVLHAVIEVPAGLPGVFLWRGEAHELAAGSNRFDLPVK